jgi:hypothetical protein
MSLGAFGGAFIGARGGNGNLGSAAGEGETRGKTGGVAALLVPAGARRCGRTNLNYTGSSTRVHS